MARRLSHKTGLHGAARAFFLLSTTGHKNAAGWPPIACVNGLRVVSSVRQASFSILPATSSGALGRLLSGDLARSGDFSGIAPSSPSVRVPFSKLPKSTAACTQSPMVWWLTPEDRSASLPQYELCAVHENQETSRRVASLAASAHSRCICDSVRRSLSHLECRSNMHPGLRSCQSVSLSIRDRICSCTTLTWLIRSHLRESLVRNDKPNSFHKLGAR